MQTTIYLDKEKSSFIEFKENTTTDDCSLKATVRLRHENNVLMINKKLDIIEIENLIEFLTQALKYRQHFYIMKSIKNT